MTATPPQLHFDPERFACGYDREPFAFTHSLSTLPMFSFAHLRRLAETYAAFPQDYFVADSAPSAAAAFYSVPHGRYPPHEAIDRLGIGSHRVLLKRLETHDADFRALLQHLFSQVLAARGGLHGEKILRLESAVFISSGAATTPFHFDPEVNFFAQIEGEKRYHVYAPAAVGELELERFYAAGIVNIGQLDLAGRDPAQQHAFTLGPGLGLHQPQNAPHWVETGSARSISYSFVYETDAGRARGRARACNHYLRKLGLHPLRPGARPVVDALKAGTMRGALPARRRVGELLRAARGR